ncbi:MAG: hypothetical protein IJ452_08740, partial [Butyricicoccus sp.]|nr:hypothetical protein [Butyricicoccus sp.]
TVVQIFVKRIIVQIRKQRQPVVKDRTQAKCFCLFVSNHGEIVCMPVLIQKEGIQFQQQREIRTNIGEPGNSFDKVDGIRRFKRECCDKIIRAFYSLFAELAVSRDFFKPCNQFSLTTAN